MKKNLLIILALVMVLVLVGCAGGNDSGVTSPMKKISSLDKLSEKANCALIRPEGVNLEDEAYYLIDGNPQIAEYSFTMNGAPCSLRFANVDISTDISGIIRDGSALFADTEMETTYIENDDLKAQRWVTVDGQYIFVVMDQSEWEWNTFDDISSQFMKMEPKNWNSDVPFSAYQALEGSYYSENNDVVGAVTIVRDHAGIYVIVDQPDGSRLYWEMDAVLKDNELVYEKEKISRIEYDETAGETVFTDLDDGAAGSVEVKGDTLIFANAYSEQLKGLVLTAAK